MSHMTVFTVFADAIAVTCSCMQTADIQVSRRLAQLAETGLIRNASHNLVWPISIPVSTVYCEGSPMRI